LAKALKSAFIYRLAEAKGNEMGAGKVIAVPFMG